LNLFIFRDTNEYPVVGLDCQFNQYEGSRNKVGLLQVSSHKGNVALISLGSGQKVPPEITSILADKNIIKSGLEPSEDAQKLYQDYSISVQGTYDLRYLAEAAGYKPDSLVKLSKNLLGVDLHRSDSLFDSWSGPDYTQAQVDYAKKSAKASVDIFKKLISKVLWWESKGNILSYCKEKIDKPFVYYSERYN
jgi:ribonuclease D